MPASEQEQSHINELIEAHAAHLKALQIQSARLGVSAPAHIATEIDRYERELAQLRQSAAISISGELAEDLGVIGRYQLMSSHIMRLDTDIHRLSRKVDKLEDLINRLLIELAKSGQSRVRANRRNNNRRGAKDE